MHNRDNSNLYITYGERQITSYGSYFPGADQDSVRTSYKRLALKWHPDKHRNSTESIKVRNKGMFPFLISPVLVNFTINKNTQINKTIRLTTADH